MTKQTVDSGLGLQAMNNQQWKIYTDRYVMYARRRSEIDSSAGFGIGTYQVDNGKVIENMFFGESGVVNARFELAIDKHADGYSQVLDFPGDVRRYIWTEDYKRLDRNITSSLDGAWSLEKQISIDKNGKSAARESSDSGRQFKLYHTGNFIWANSWKDEASGKWNSAYGYGTFEKNGADQITENNVSSTYGGQLIGNPVKLGLKFTGKDRYEQTIVWEDGSKMIEVYKRLK